MLKEHQGPWWEGFPYNFHMMLAPLIHVGDPLSHKDPKEKYYFIFQVIYVYRILYIPTIQLPYNKAQVMAQLSILENLDKI